MMPRKCIYIQFLILLITATLWIALYGSYVINSLTGQTPPTPKLGPDLASRVKSATKCSTQPLQTSYRQRSNYWVLYNYIKASIQFQCHKSITYTTHATFDFLENIVPLVKRWNGPVSVAVYAPGTDFQYALESITHLRSCATPLVSLFVTFHLFFERQHLPDYVPNSKLAEQKKTVDCSILPPYLANLPRNQTYKFRNRLLYPVNVARNIARESAQTYFVLASDIELYPSLNLIPDFLEMIATDADILNNPRPFVFPLNLFEVDRDQTVPTTKTELRFLHRRNRLTEFHKSICSLCHQIPKGREWLLTLQSKKLHVFHVAKRYEKWEPIFIGTNNDPWYDERYFWEKQRDKMSQAYLMCLLNYDFMILNNAFLVHKPGIKKAANEINLRYMEEINSLEQNHVLPELNKLFRRNRHCNLN